MGNPRRRPQFLAEKLLLVRVHLNVSETAMQKMLKLPKTTPVAEYENGKREPNLIVLLAYARLGEIPMCLFADDDVSLDGFREQLGTFGRKEFEKLVTPSIKKNRKSTHNV